MKREKQYDMFDVATGACTLLDYLFQRYSENDLSTTFWVDPKDEVDELLAPAPLEDGRPGSEPVVRPVQGPRAPERIAKRPFGPPLPPEEEEQTSPVPPQSVSNDDGRAPTPAGSGSPQSALDGMDSLVRKSPETASPGFETFQKTAQESGASPDSFQSQGSESNEPAPSVSPSAEAPSPAAPSMDELLAQFHRATQDYNQRTQLLAQIEGEASVSPDANSEDENAQEEGSP